MLSVSGLEKRFGGRDLVESASFRLNPGEKVTLVGVNGSGKSTLLKVLAGQIEPDAGEIGAPRDTTIGYLPQHAEMETDRTVYDELHTLYDHVKEHQAELEQLAHQMGEVPHDSPEYEQVTSRYGHLQHELDRLGVYEIESKIERMMAGLGFAPRDRDRKTSEFSGGWQMRILLAKLLLENPDILLLDEPTNHLDLETMIWLENWIRAGDSTVLFVSHERKFMDALAERTFEIHEGKLAIYRGNYSEYLRQREDRWAQWQREYENQQGEMAQIQRFIDRFRYNASKATLVQSRVRQLEKIVPIPPPPKAAPSIHFRFPAADRGNKEVIKCEGITKNYGPLRVLDNIDFTLWRGEKVALVGLNGAGKSTLLKLLNGQEKPTTGAIERGQKTKLAYFAQYDTEGLTSGNTVWHEMSAVAPIGMQETARSLLGGFFFTGDDVEKPVDVLSGGERTRLRLAKMLFSGANALLLDEPTNHLDIASRATLERAIRDYEGSVVIVSHDRTFIDAVVTRIVEVKEGGLRSFPGNYSEYCYALKVLGETSPLVDSMSSAAGKKPSAGANGASAAPKPAKAPEKVHAKPAAQPAASAPKTSLAAAKAASPGSASRAERKEASKEQRRIQKMIESLEREIEKVEARLKEVEAELTLPEVYRDHTKLTPLVQEQTKLKDAHAALLSQWERQAAALERS